MVAFRSGSPPKATRCTRSCSDSPLPDRSSWRDCWQNQARRSRWSAKTGRCRPSNSAMESGWWCRRICQNRWRTRSASRRRRAKRNGATSRLPRLAIDLSTGVRRGTDGSHVCLRCRNQELTCSTCGEGQYVKRPRADGANGRCSVDGIALARCKVHCPDARIPHRLRTHR